MNALLEVTDLKKTFPVGRGLLRRARGEVRAVDGVSLCVAQGESLGLVGESGCGKSTLARCILRLTEPSAGGLRFDGADVRTFDAEQLRRYRRKVQIVFQDPFGSLNPRMTAGQLLAEPLEAHGLTRSRGETRQRVGELLELVGLGPDHSGRYPHAFSGGQRQRIAIARALAVQPRLLILDEPVAALDVSVAAQIVNQLAELQDELGVAYLVISHELSLIRQLTDRVVVMYLGAVMETADTNELFGAAQHPYTQALLSAAPVPDPAIERSRTRIPLRGDVPSTLDTPPACRFHTRCFKAEAECATREPPLTAVTGSAHRASCWFPEPWDYLAQARGGQRPE